MKENCRICKEVSSEPRQFKLAARTHELRFNHRVQVDTMYIGGRPAIHMVDEATHFCSASFLHRRSTKNIWKSIRQMWYLVYLGRSDYLAVDQGSAYSSKELRVSAEAFGMHLREAPIKTPGAIQTAEMYYALLWLAYKRICAETDRQTRDQEFFRLTVFAVKCTPGPESLCPELLFFGDISRLAHIFQAQSQLKRAMLINRIIEMVAKE